MFLGGTRSSLGKDGEAIINPSLLATLCVGWWKNVGLSTAPCLPQTKGVEGKKLETGVALKKRQKAEKAITLPKNDLILLFIVVVVLVELT